MTQALQGKKILLVISGGIAAYRALELIRLIRRAGGTVRCILSAGGAQFITPLSVASLSGEEVHTDLWSLKDETEMGHIRLSREADLVVVAPASANMIAKMAHGLADDLAATTLLATNKPVLIAPAMNPAMWANEATQENIKTLQSRAIQKIGPCQGDVACGETGMGRMAEPEAILEAIQKALSLQGEGLGEGERVLKGLKALVTSGPTHEPLDPVRFIGNRSSGKQGHAIAQALADQGAAVTLVTGPVALPDPPGVETIHVETAVEMWNACESTLPADIAVCAAAVSDWGPKKYTGEKIKKRRNHTPPSLSLKENPDILARLSKAGDTRPRLVIGFAAETEALVKNATEKRVQKGCDWIVANLVGNAEKTFGGDENHVYLITSSGTEEWDKASKAKIAARLAENIAQYMNDKTIRNVAAE